MKLSFVIPALNEEKYIGACLDSIFGAIGERNDMEVVVVDNASTDRTQDVVKKYPRAKLAYEPRRGTNMARQAGVDNSSGELIAHIDADSLPTRNWLERVIKEFEENRGVVCVSGPYVYYDLPRSVNVMVKIFYNLAYILYLITNLFVGRTTFLQGGNFVVRRDAIVKMGGYNTDITFYGDETDTAKRLNKIGKIKFSFKLAIPSSGRRLATEGITVTALRYVFNYLWIALFNKPFTPTSTATRPVQENNKLRLHGEANKKDVFVGISVLCGTLLIIAIAIYFIYRGTSSVLGF